MSHGLLSSSLNLGLLDPAECVERAEAAWRAGRAPLNSAEGFVPEHNHRMTRAVRGLDRLAGLAEVRSQERARGDSPP